MSAPPAMPRAPLRYASPAGRWVLLATVLASGMTGLDATIVGVALPTIGREFSVSVAALQWVVNAYTLVLTGLLLFAGALGDRYGRRRMLVAGTALFAGASLLCGLAPTATLLIAARALQGVAGAILAPVSLAILQAGFDGEDRSRAIGAWSGLGGVATAAGPFAGGWLIGAVSWRLAFLVNLPIAVAVVLAARHVPDDPSTATKRRLDLPGAAAVTAGLASLTYGLIEGPARGWTEPVVLAGLVAGPVLLALFLLREALTTAPMLPLRLFASAQFSAANGITFVVYAALGGSLFLLPVVLQQAAGYSPLAAGTALLPVTAIMLALSAWSGALAARIGPRLQMTVGPLVIAAGLALLTRLETQADYVAQLLPAVAVFGLGLAINVAPLTATALGAAPPAYTGVASAVNNDVARAGGLIAVAVLPVAAGITSATYPHPLELLHGFHVAVLIAAAACAAAAGLAALTIRNPPHLPRRPAHDPAAHRHLHCGVEGPPLREYGAASAHR